LEWDFFCPSSFPREAAMQEEGKINAPHSFLRLQAFLTAWVLLIILLSAAQAKAAPSRIISLSPAVTEILFALGEGGRLAGVTDFCKFPPAATRLPKVGGFLNPSYERMLSLGPDLIIHQADSKAIADFARQAGFKNLAVSMLTLKEIFHTIETLGALLDRQAAAAALSSKLRAELKSRKDEIAPLGRKSVFLLLGVGNEPAQTLYGVGPDTYLGELLALAGGDNILSPSLPPYPKINKEFLIARSPEVIIEVGPAVLPQEELTRRKNQWRQYSTLQAVKDEAIHFLGGDELLVPGPRFILVLDRFIQALHPERPPRPAEAGLPSGAPEP